MWAPQGYESFAVELPGGTSYELVVDVGTRDPIVQAYRGGWHTNENLITLLDEFTGPDGCVLDLGAHVGTFSLAAAARGHRVIAVDASPKHVDLLRQSVVKNQFTRVDVIHAAVGETSGKVKFHMAGLWGMVDRTGAPRVDAAPMVTVPAVVGDRLLRKLRCKRVDFLKMDVEGSEMAAIRGLRRLLTRADAPAIAFECNGWTLPEFGFHPKDLLAQLEEFGYASYHTGPEMLRPCRPDDLQPEMWLDLVALKPVHRQTCAARIGPPMETREIVDRIVLESGREHENHRIHLARVLSRAINTIRDEPRVRGVLDSLIRDPNEQVRQAVRACGVPKMVGAGTDFPR